MHGQLWTPEEDAGLRRMLAEGRTHRAMAEALGRPRSSIESRMNTLGLRARPVLAPPPGAPRWRPCLCCGKTFVSAGPGNRLCSRCRTISVSPYAL